MLRSSLPWWERVRGRGRLVSLNALSVYWPSVFVMPSLLRAVHADARDVGGDHAAFERDAL